MERKTMMARSIEIAGKKADYDENIKEFLAYKPILALILMECAEEFKGMTREQIESCIQDTEVNRYAIHQGEQKLVDSEDDENRIIGLNTEEVNDIEGTVRFDIRFAAIINGIEENIRLFINIEGQKSNKEYQYPLEKRTIYYLSRMISSQYGTVFKNEEYGKICKVYSIWLVSSPKAMNRNSITRFRIVKDDIFGKSEYNKENYDLMTGVVVNLYKGDDTVENQLLRFMNKILDDKTSVIEKERFIEEEYHIPMTEEVKEEVNNMGSFGDLLIY